MPGLSYKVQQIGQILTQEGPRALASACGTAAGKWWRHGELWEIRKSNYVRLDGCRIGLEAVYPEKIRSLLATGRFERDERDAIRRFLDTSLPVVELGGCIGVVACATNRKLLRPERHIVVEANPHLIRHLEENRRRNHSKFVVLHRAVSYGSSFVDLHFQEDDPLASNTIRDLGKSERVRSITLREIQREFEFDTFSLICDIEGSEVEMVEHDCELLSKRVRVIVMEVHDRVIGRASVEGMLASLHEGGFDIASHVGDTYVLRNRRLQKGRV